MKKEPEATQPNPKPESVAVAPQDHDYALGKPHPPVTHVVDGPEPAPGVEAQELKAAQVALERDRTKVAECLEAVKKALRNYDWLLEGRGPYAWNDDRWHDEFRRASVAIWRAIDPMVKIAADWTNCPQTDAEVQAARASTSPPTEELARRIAEARIGGLREAAHIAQKEQCGWTGVDAALDGIWRNGFSQARAQIAAAIERASLSANPGPDAKTNEKAKVSRD